VTQNLTFTAVKQRNGGQPDPATENVADH
jgi:hypothetical protein